MLHELIRYAARPVYKVLRREAPKLYLTILNNTLIVMIILKNSQIHPLSTCAHNGQIHYFLAHNAQDSVFS